jgi:CelD/BcsL family acetyltransferase involved in cellulose biosynthesis
MNMNADITTTLYVQRLSGPEALAALVDEWELLDLDILPRMPFTSPLWNCLWWKHFRRHHLIFRDAFFCHVVRDAGGRLVAIAPLMQTYCLGLCLPGIRMVQFFGADPSITEIRGVICRPEDQHRVIRSLAEHFTRGCGSWDVFRWHGLRQDMGDYDALGARYGFETTRELPDYIFDLPASWEELKARVSSNMRKNLRKAYEFLERDKCDFTLRVVERPPELQPAIERFLTLHAARSEAADMITHPNKFRRPPNRAFLIDYLHRMAERDQVRIFELDIGGTVVASRLSFVLGTTLYMYFAGYDPAWKKYSVMTVLVSEMIKWAIDQGLREVNLSTGNDQSKLRWKPTEIVYRDVMQISPTPRGRIVSRALWAYEKLSHMRDRLGR